MITKQTRYQKFLPGGGGLGGQIMGGRTEESKDATLVIAYVAKSNTRQLYS